MDSDSSSCDFGCSREKELDPNVVKAFEVMKSKISSHSSSKDSSLFGTNERKIYQTFNNSQDIDKSSSTKKDRSKKVQKPKLNKASTDNIRPVEFFIDKGPSTYVAPEEDNKALSETEVITLDLTNIGDNAIEENGDASAVKKKKKKRKEKKKIKESQDLSSRLQTTISSSNVYLNVDPDAGLCKEKQLQKHKEPDIMKKSVITDDFEKQDSIATTHVSVRQMKKQRKLEKEKTKGDKWFNMPATELTDETKDDLMVIQMRKALDPKRFYKANDLKAPPKYFQFGRVEESAADFYHSRVPQKQRKSTIVEELLADVEFRKYNKRKYEEIQDAKRQGKGPYKHMKRLKKRKK